MCVLLSVVHRETKEKHDDDVHVKLFYFVMTRLSLLSFAHEGKKVL